MKTLLKSDLETLQKEKCCKCKKMGCIGYFNTMPYCTEHFPLQYRRSKYKKLGQARKRKRLTYMFKHYDEN